MAGKKRGAAGRHLAEQRGEDVARSVRVGKQLAVAFLVQGDAEIAEERDRFVDAQRAQHLPDDRAAAAPEVVLRHRGVGDVAAGPAAHEDLRPRLARPLEEDDAQRRVQSPREDGSGHPRRAGADDRDIAGRRKGQPANTVLCRVRPGRDDGRMRAARVAADDQRLPVFQAADRLGSMTAAFGAELRRLR